MISVDDTSVHVYSGSYPDNTIISTAMPGATVFLRFDVHDPFGADDITDVGLVITDSLNNVIVNTTLDDTDVVAPSLPAPTSDFKTYEYD